MQATTYTKQPNDSIQEARESFTGSRAPLEDVLFAASLDVDENLHRFVLAVRQSIAILCGIDQNYLLPGDKTKELSDLMLFEGKQGWDNIAFSFVLEETLGETLKPEFVPPPFITLRFFFYRFSGPQNFGHWAQDTSKRIAGTVHHT